MQQSQTLLRIGLTSHWRSVAGATAALDFRRYVQAHAPSNQSSHTVDSGLGVALPHLTRTGCIYLDYNATTPIFPEVAAEMAPFLFEHFGNPSSGHTYGRVCKAAVDRARQSVADLIGAETPAEVKFTSCGTESDNWVIYGAVAGWRQQHLAAAGAATAASGPPAELLPHVVTSAVEHPAVLVHLKHLQDQGLLTYTAVPVDAEGLVHPAAVAAAVRRNTVLVTVMHSNNEVGAVQPIAQIAAAARAAHDDALKTAAAADPRATSPWSRGGGPGAATGRLLVHTDAAQSTGKVELDVGALGVDAMTLVGHKFGAPKGVAALYVRRGVTLPNYFHGGGQEGGCRAGTENVMQVVGLGAAAELARREGPALRRHMAEMARELLAAVRGAVLPEEQDKLRLNGPADRARRLPNTLSLSIRGLDSSAALQRLSSRLAASAGAACHSADGSSVSGVLKAMQVPVDFAVGTLRLSTGRHTTREEVQRAAALVTEEARRQGVLGG